MDDSVILNFDPLSSNNFRSTFGSQADKENVNPMDISMSVYFNNPLSSQSNPTQYSTSESSKGRKYGNLIDITMYLDGVDEEEAEESDENQAPLIILDDLPSPSRSPATRTPFTDITLSTSPNPSPSRSSTKNATSGFCTPPKSRSTYGETQTTKSISSVMSTPSTAVRIPLPAEEPTLTPETVRPNRVLTRPPPKSVSRCESIPEALCSAPPEETVDTRPLDNLLELSDCPLMFTIEPLATPAKPISAARQDSGGNPSLEIPPQQRNYAAAGPSRDGPSADLQHHSSDPNSTLDIRSVESSFDLVNDEASFLAKLPGSDDSMIMSEKVPNVFALFSKEPIQNHVPPLNFLSQTGLPPRADEETLTPINTIHEPIPDRQTSHSPLNRPTTSPRTQRVEQGATSPSAVPSQLPLSRSATPAEMHPPVDDISSSRTSRKHSRDSSAQLPAAKYLNRQGSRNRDVVQNEEMAKDEPRDMKPILSTRALASRPLGPSDSKPRIAPRASVATSSVKNLAGLPPPRSLRTTTSIQRLSTVPSAISKPDIRQPGPSSSQATIKIPSKYTSRTLSTPALPEERSARLGRTSSASTLNIRTRSTTTIPPPVTSRARIPTTTHTRTSSQVAATQPLESQSSRGPPRPGPVARLMASSRPRLGGNTSSTSERSKPGN